jgi:hypothetical protein
MFDLWRRNIVEKKEILIKANNVEELLARIARAERGLLEDEGEARRRSESDEGMESV